MTPKRYTKTVYLRMSDRNGERSQYAENEQESAGWNGLSS